MKLGARTKDNISSIPQPKIINRLNLNQSSTAALTKRASLSVSQAKKDQDAAKKAHGNNKIHLYSCKLQSCPCSYTKFEICIYFHVGCYSYTERKPDCKTNNYTRIKGNRSDWSPKGSAKAFN